jgi:hypothetical protein
MPSVIDAKMSKEDYAIARERVSPTPRMPEDQPIPPRPEGQGAVTHARANDLLDNVMGATVELRRYIAEQAAREQAQSAEIELADKHADERIAEAESLRAELAALKQPVPVDGLSPGVAARSDNDRRVYEWQEVDGNRSYLARHDSIVAMLNEAEQRGRASRDGVVPAVEAWRELGDANRSGVLSAIRLGPPSLAWDIAARALESLCRSNS